jgi:hypothetical protein
MNVEKTVNNKAEDSRSKKCKEDAPEVGANWGEAKMSDGKVTRMLKTGEQKRRGEASNAKMHPGVGANWQLNQ